MEAIFDFKDINRRMNRKPMIAAVEVAVDKKCVRSNCPYCSPALIPNVYIGIDPAEKGSDQTVISLYNNKTMRYGDAVPANYPYLLKDIMRDLGLTK